MNNATTQTNASTGQPIPAVGMGATMHHFSDSDAWTVIAVKSKKTIVIQRDICTRVDGNGLSEEQRHEYSRDEAGQTLTVTQRKNGRWVPQGFGMENSLRVTLGHRDKYCDFTF